MNFIKILITLVVASSSIQAEDEQPPAEQPPIEQPPAEQPPIEQPLPQDLLPTQPPIEQPPPQTQPPVIELVATTATPLATESWKVETLEYTDFPMAIDHSLDDVLVRIVDWQASMFEYIQLTLTKIWNEWNTLKASIRAGHSTEAAAIKSIDISHSKSLLQQQVSLFKEALSTGYIIENDLVHKQKSIDQWITEVNNNVEGARDRKVDISSALDELVSAARNQIKETKSSIQKIFQNHYYDIENDRLSMNGKLDKLVLEVKATVAQLVTTTHTSNNSLYNRLTQEENTLQELIDSTISGFRHHLDSNLIVADRDKILNHLDERAKQLDENLFVGYSENQKILDNFVESLISDSNNNIWALDNDVNVMKNQFEQMTSINKLRANRLSIQTYKTLEPVESLLFSLSEKLKRTVDSV